MDPGEQQKVRIRKRLNSSTIEEEETQATDKLAPEVRIKQIGMREDLLSIIRHTSSDHFSEEELHHAAARISSCRSYYSSYI